MEQEQYLTTFSAYPDFYSSLKQQAGQLLGCSFSSNNYHELHSEGTLLPQFVVVKRGEVEHTLLRFRQQQNGTPSMHACFVLGAKVAKSSTIFPLLKSMRVLLQGKKDRNIPYSYVVYYAPPIHCISLGNPHVCATVFREHVGHSAREHSSVCSVGRWSDHDLCWHCFFKVAFVEHLCGATQIYSL
jgi:hypothetical protein